MLNKLLKNDKIKKAAQYALTKLQPELKIKPNTVIDPVEQFHEFGPKDKKTYQKLFVEKS